MFEELLDLTSTFTSIFRKIAKNEKISLSQAFILLSIDNQGSSMSQLSYQIGLDNSTMTRNIEKLEKRHFVYRERSTNDTRKVLVLKSPKGVDLSNKLEDQMSSLFNSPIKNKIDIENKLNKLTWYLMKVKNKNAI